MFLNLTLNDLNLGLLAVIFNISLSLKPATLSAVLNRSYFAPPLLASVKAFSNIFFLLLFLKLFCCQGIAQSYLYHLKRNLQKFHFKFKPKKFKLVLAINLHIFSKTVLNYKEIAVNPLTSTGKVI